MPYELLIGPDGFDHVCRDWAELESRGRGHVFQTLDFTCAWLRTAGISTDATPLIVRYQTEGRTVGLFPACEVRHRSLRLTTWMAGPYVLDYGDILFDPEGSDITADEFVTESLHMLHRRTRTAPLYLTNVREDALVYPALARVARTYKTSAAPFVDTSGDFGDYLATLTKNTRHNVRRRMRRLEEIGLLEFRLLSRGNEGWEPALHRLLDEKHRRYSRLEPGSGVFTPGYPQFREAQMGCDPCTRIALLTLAGDFLAAQIVSVYRRRMYLLVSGFDPDRASLSPGLVLDYSTIRHCFESDDIDVCDFCWGTEAHKYQWTSDQMPMATFVSDDLQGRIVSAVAGAHRDFAAWRDARHAHSRQDED